MLNRPSSLLALAALPFLVGCVTTQEDAASVPMMDQATFAVADSNADGKLSKAELAKHKHKSALAEFDLDSDNMISATEWSAAKASAGERDEHFKRLDKDGDRQVEEDEAIRYITEHAGFGSAFRAVDANQDGFLHWEEIAEAETDSIDFTLFSLKQ